MDIEIIGTIASQLGIQPKQVEAVLTLLEEGSTVPFIARYRKERTGNLDEEQIRVIEEQYTYRQNVEKRKEEVLHRIETVGSLTPEIKASVMACTKLAEIEEIYRPYKQKKKTRAGIAISHGLKPLAERILSCPRDWKEENIDAYLNEDVTDRQAALQGAMDILAQQFSEDSALRDTIFTSMMKYGRIETQIKKDAEDEKKIYRMYYDFSCRVDRVANHQIMAINRAEKEKVITVHVTCNEDYLHNWAHRHFIRYRNNPCATYIDQAVQDSLKRLAIPSLERLVRSQLTERAQKSSMDVFSMNLEKLLLQAPLKDKTIMGFDPAFRTGCKLAIIDPSGKALCVDVIYPHKPNQKIAEAKRKFVQLCTDYHVDIVAIGNGTASRESEAFVADVIKEYHLPVVYSIVSEAGASVYSASKLAIAEFPDLHVEQRSAISIARRLLDPLSELIKIDPQSIGVGQYQHDLPQKELKERLHFVVEKAVNRVGVNINTASVSLLENVSGLSHAMAQSIVSYREENGWITNRNQIKKIPKIGPKSFEQSAGFLRIESGDEPLDRTSIHPESYALARQLLKQLKLTTSDMGTPKAKAAIEKANDSLYKGDDYTIRDICEAIMQPLRDYRENSAGPILKKDVLTMEDLHVGDQLEGVVRNVVDFGAFVDIGLHEDGLVHISKMAHHRVNHPSEIVSVGDIVTVWVYHIDEEKGKVQLSLVQPR